MTPKLIRIVAAACLGAALVPAQHEHDVVVRKVRTDAKKKASDKKTHATVLHLIEKLSDGDLSAADRKKCKQQLIKLLGKAHKVEGDALLEVRPIISKVRRPEGEEVAIAVEVSDDWNKNLAKKAKSGKPAIRWHVDKKGNVAHAVEVEEVARPRILSVKPTEIGEDVIVEVDTAIVQDPKKAKARDDLGARAKRLRARLGDVPTLGRLFEKGDGDEKTIVRYHTIEDAKRAVEGAQKAHAEALRAHREAMKAHHEALEAHGEHGVDVFRLRKGGDAKGGIYFLDQDPKKAKSKSKAKNKSKGGVFTFEVDEEGHGKGDGKKNRFFTFEVDGTNAFEIEGLEKQLKEAMKNFHGNAEVEFDFMVHDEHGKPGKGKARAFVSDDPHHHFWVQGKAKGKSKDKSKGGIWVVGSDNDKPKAIYEWLERAPGHGHHEHEEHEHAEHEEECEECEEECEECEEECEECEEECEEIEESVDELTEMIHEMREEMAELREMMAQIRQMLRARTGHDTQKGGWRRVSGDRREYVAPSRVRYVRERRDR